MINSGILKSINKKLIVIFIIWILLLANILFFDESTNAFPTSKLPDKKINVNSDPFGIAVGDLNNDSLLDIVVVSKSWQVGSVQIFYKRPNNQYPTVADVILTDINYAWQASIGDLNNDSLNDLCVKDWTSYNINIYYQQKNNTLPTTANLTLDSNYYWGVDTHIGDLNNDGLNDILQTDSVFYQLKNNTFNQTPDTVLKVGLQPWAFGIIDLNNDTLNDVIVAYQNSDMVAVFYQLKNHTISTKRNVTLKVDNPYCGTVADINSDGLNDIITTSTNKLCIFYQNQSNAFSRYPDINFSTWGDPLFVETGDLNGDGLIDICANSGILNIYYQKENLTFETKPSFITSSPSGWIRQFSIFDLNDDNLNDIAATLWDTNKGISQLWFYYQDNGTSLIYTGKVKPKLGIVGETFNYTVTYQNRKNETPLFVNVSIDGINHTMNELYSHEINYTSGKSFFYLHKFNSSGLHSFQFFVENSTEIISTNLQNDPRINFRPTLSSYNVTPSIGNLQNPLNFSIIYTDLDNEIPAYIKININGTNFTMNETDNLDSNYLDGKEYYYETKLLEDVYNYRFYTSDGNYIINTSLITGLIVDGTPPITSIIIGEPKYGKDPINLTPFSPISLVHNNDTGGAGISFTWYKINNGNTKFYMGPFTLPIIANTIEWGSEDNAKNNETGNLLRVIIDNSEPHTTMKISEPKFGVDPIYLKTSTLIELNHNNDSNGVGIAFTWYRLNDNEIKIYSNPFYLPVGTTEIAWGSQDLLGNNETYNKLNVIIDDDPPNTQIEIQNPFKGSDPTYVSSSTLFSLVNNNDNNGVGINFSWFRLNDNDFHIYKGPFSVPIGTTTIEWGSVDYLGNNETENRMNIYVDDFSPSTTINIGLPNYLNDTLYVTPSTLFTLMHNKDLDGVGIDFTWYKLNNNIIKYSKPFTIPVGTISIEWGSRDLFGNNESGNLINVYVDNKSPKTSIEIGKPNFGVDPIIITSHTKLILNANDTTPGEISIYYKIDDNGVWKSFLNNFSIQSEGEKTIYFYSKDILGNKESTNKITINVDNSPPGTPIVDEMKRLTNIKSTFVTGYAEQNCKIEILLNNESAGFTYTTDNNSFIKKIILQKGWNRITTIAFDVFERASNPSSPQIIELDITPPNIIETIPKNKVQNSPIFINVSIKFNEEMNRLSVENAFSILPLINGTFYWNNEMMIFRPTNPLIADTEYRITIESSAIDIAGNPLNKYILDFRTVKLPDSDGDKYPDAYDVFPNDPTEWLDTDGDGYGNNKDDFLDDPTEWIDTDGDNIGNNKDSDDDNDGLLDVDELKLKTNPLLWDTDGDGHTDLEDKYPLDYEKWKKSDDSDIIHIF